MKTRLNFGAAGLIGALAAFVAGPALAQSINVPINMTIGSAASAALGNPINFGTVIPAPAGGNVTLSGAGVVGGAGQLASSGTPTAGTIIVTRTGAVVATAATPASVNLTCGAATVQVAVTPDNSGCTPAAATNCTITLPATATLPAGAAPGACTAGSVTITVNYN